MSRQRNIVTAVAFAILVFQLILPPIVGVADNGDFARVIARFDLAGKVREFGSYIDATYLFHPDYHWDSEFYSTEIALMWPAVALNALLSKDGNFDLRWIGVVHGALFLAALWLFVPLLDGARRAFQIGLCALVLVVFCDVMYVSAMNSFYMDEPAYLFLLLSGVLYLRVVRWRRQRDTVLLLVCVLLLATSKTQHTLLAVVFAAVLFVVRKTLWPTRQRLIMAAAVCITAASLLMVWKGVPQESTAYALYNIIFTQLVPHSANPQRTLAELGLDDSYKSCIGKNAYFPDSHMEQPSFRAGFRKHASMGRLLGFYLTHPTDGYRALIAALDDAGRQTMFGNFDKSSGYPPFTESRTFARWSRFKRVLFFGHGQRLLFSFLGLSATFAALLWLGRKALASGMLPAGLALIAMAVVELLISALLDTSDITRHHFIFLTLMDMEMIATIAVAISVFAGLRRRKASPENQTPAQILTPQLTVGG